MAKGIARGVEHTHNTIAKLVVFAALFAGLATAWTAASLRYRALECSGQGLLDFPTLLR
jgi:hypothetical protein